MMSEEDASKSMPECAYAEFVALLVLAAAGFAWWETYKRDDEKQGTFCLYFAFS